MLLNIPDRKKPKDQKSSQDDKNEDEAGEDENTVRVSAGDPESNRIKSIETKNTKEEQTGRQTTRLDESDFTERGINFSLR